MSVPNSQSKLQCFALEPILTPSAGLVDDVEDSLDTNIDHLPDDYMSNQSTSQDLSDSSDVDFPEVMPLDHTIDDLQEIPFVLPEDVKPTFESGTFVVGESGEVSIDFLFDGGKLHGELAIFSLDGMDGLEPGSEAFIREAAQRALSNSELGYVVISDSTEGARFSGSFGWERDFNDGDYLGVKTFQMEPGSQFGVMLVPNNTIEYVSEHPSSRPLFSMATANPDDSFQSGQIVDVTGDGNTFVFEDLRVDQRSDRDYNDIVFQVRGATGYTDSFDDHVDPAKDWRGSDIGQAISTYTVPYITVTPDSFDLPEEFISTEEIDDTSTLDLPFEEQLNDFPEGFEEIYEDPTFFDLAEDPNFFEFPQENQPLIGFLDAGLSQNNPYINYDNVTFGYDWVEEDANPLFEPGTRNEHGTHIVGIVAAQSKDYGIEGLNNDAPIWIGAPVETGNWSKSLIEFVNAAKDSGQPNAIANLSFELVQSYPDGSVAPRYEFTPEEWAALEYAHQNNVLVVVAAGNNDGTISALGQASQTFDNIITVGSAQDLGLFNSVPEGFERADYSNYGQGLDILANGGTPDNPILSTVGDGLGLMAGTSVAASQVTGTASLVWAANPNLSYQQVIQILKSTATDLETPNWDAETGVGLLNLVAAVHLAKATTPKPVSSKEVSLPDTWWTSVDGAIALEQPAATITPVNFSGKVIATIGARVRTGPGTNFSIVQSLPYNTNVQFDAWTTGQFISYPGIGASDRWYRISGTNHWIAAAIVQGEPPTSPGAVVIGGFAISQPFLSVWQTYQGTLKNPISPVTSHSSGAKYQLFQGGSIVNSQFGTYPLYGGIRQAYLRNGGLNGWLGAPKSAEYSWQGKIRQDFANGYIVWNGSGATTYRNNGQPVGSISPIPTPLPSPSPSGWQRPVAGSITSDYGWRRDPITGVRKFHYGIDIAAPLGTPVRAARSGRVVIAAANNGWNDGYGNFVVIDHGDGTRSYYAHLSSVNVAVNQVVSNSTMIGQVGSTGSSTGPHLHFEVRVAPYSHGVNNRNPRNYINF
jgi:murein DD-endopeptidase MepM/ murein hydrolase activator NlpD